MPIHEASCEEQSARCADVRGNAARDYTGSSPSAKLVPQLVEAFCRERPAQIIRLQLLPQLLFLHARLDGFGHPLTKRSEVLPEGPNVLLRQHRTVAWNGRVEVQLQHAV